MCVYCVCLVKTLEEDARAEMHLRLEGGRLMKPSDHIHAPLLGISFLCLTSGTQSIPCALPFIELAPKQPAQGHFKGPWGQSAESLS